MTHNEFARVSRELLGALNYWEPAPGASLPAGRTEWGDVQVDTRADFSARIVMDIRYRPAVLCFGPHTLKAGQTLCLRYRVLMHPGR